MISGVWHRPALQCGLQRLENNDPGTFRHQAVGAFPIERPAGPARLIVAGGAQTRLHQFGGGCHRQGRVGPSANDQIAISGLDHIPALGDRP